MHMQLPTPGGVDLVKQIDYVLAAVPSGAVLIIFNAWLKILMRQVLKIAIFATPTVGSYIPSKSKTRSKFPPPLVGMFLFFGTMLSLSEANAAKFVDFFAPALDLVTNFLPLFFVPGLISTPAALEGVGLVDVCKFFVVIFMGMVAIAIKSAYVVEYVMKISKVPQPPSQPPTVTKKGQFKSWFSPELEKLFGFLTLATGVVSLGKKSVQQLYYGSATMFSFVVSSRLPRFLPPDVAKFLHPLIITYFMCTTLFMFQGALRGMGLHSILGEYLVSGSSWNTAAGNFIMFFLEPAIISFSFGLFSRKKLLQENFAAIFLGAFSSSFMGILIMSAIVRVLVVPHELGKALMPRATAALAIVQANMIGASTALTTVHCCVIGVLGANFGPNILAALGMNNPISRGVGLGGGGLAVAAASLAGPDPAAFPFAVLSMTLTSTISTFLFTMPWFQRLVFWVAGVPF